MRDPVATRRVTAEDVPELARMLARAFFDDPVAIWTCRSDRLRPRVLERFHAARLRQLLADQEIWTTQTLTSAALWAPPQRWRTTARQDLEIARISLMHPRMFVRGPLIGAGFLGMERKHPHHPSHWYLAVLGTEPAAQGQGLGSAVLAPVLEQCDADGVGAYVESSKERNIDFYARHGFRLTAELRMPRGPKLWAMWREARGAPASAAAGAELS
jgi:ribosomal protein S18 acetylase RimI-like enzyme